jgi:hypothetical protein
MTRQEHDNRANGQTSRLALLKKEMVYKHHCHVKDCTQQKLTDEKERQEARMSSMVKYLNKYDTGCGKWKSMEFNGCPVKQLLTALIEHVKHNLKECVYTVKSLASEMDLKHGINLK